MKTVAYLPGALKTLEQQLTKSLGQFYDQFTVDEWLEQHIRPWEQRIDELMRMAKGLTEKSVWPRRPLNYGSNHEKMIQAEDPLNQMPRR